MRKIRLTSLAVVNIIVLAACGGPSLAPGTTPSPSSDAETSVPVVPTPTTFVGHLPTPASTVTPASVGSPAPIDAPTVGPPTVDFSVDVIEGPAPLTITLTNLSENATEYQWDFGDGTQSPESQPKHTYTKAGTYTVRLKAIRRVGASALAGERIKHDLVTVRPGPVTELQVIPASSTLKPEETLFISMKAFDQFGNSISDPQVSWTASGEVGKVTQDGRFTAGIRAGHHSGAVRVQVAYGGESEDGLVDITIRPGPIERANVTAMDATMYTGDTTQLTVLGTDRYGNSISDLNIRWVAEGGTVDARGNYKAGRISGQYTISALVSDGQGEVEDRLGITVDQGYCSTERNFSQWNAEWFALNDDGSWGDSLGSTQYPGVFSVEGESSSSSLLLGSSGNFGPVFAGRADMLGLVASTQIVVQRQGPVKFKVGGDDGFRLYLDGNLIIADWATHSYREESFFKNLEPGIYNLELEYFEWTGQAKLTFETDVDVLFWEEAKECFGGYLVPPGQVRYFIYPSQILSVSQIADKFGFNQEELQVGQIGADRTAFVPGGQLGGHRYIIYLQGRSSFARCEPSSDSEKELQATLLLTTHAVQTMGSVVPSKINAEQIRGFSYSGLYKDCESGVSYTAETYPLIQWVFPIYLPEDTCDGVEPAAQKLEELLGAIVKEQPEATFDLIGHSLGGLVISYFAAVGPEPLLSRVNSVITLDSPLLGTSLSQLLTGACGEDSPTNLDLSGQSEVVATVKQGLLTRPEVLERSLSIEASIIGSHVPGTYYIDVPTTCQATYTLAGLMAGVIFWPVFLPSVIAGSIADAHTCVPYEPESLQAIATWVSVERVQIQ